MLGRQGRDKEMRWNKQLFYRFAYMAQGACSPPPPQHTHIHIIESTVRIVRILRTALVGIMQGSQRDVVYGLSWLTNSALLLYMSPNAWGERGGHFAGS